MLNYGIIRACVLWEVKERLKLKEDSDLVIKVKTTVFNIVEELKNVEANKAIEVSSWFLIKSNYIKRLSNGSYNKIPKSIKRGDIVRVEFGINIGEELSDENRDGHFAIIWGQQGFTFLVIPLTTTIQIKNPYAINLGKIDGLPQNTDSYAKLDYMRWIDKNRIKFMFQHDSGKIEISDTEQNANIINLIKSKMKEMYIDN